MNYIIIGGGFGLYGYLPALLVTGNRVLLPKKYRQRILSRPDLIELESQITWVPTLDDGLREAHTVIIATQPSVQVELVNRIVDDFCNVKRFYLEKPISETPLAGDNLLIKLKGKSKSVAVGFLFLQCLWIKQLENAVKSNDFVNILWTFEAHHFRNGIRNWKRYHNMGGGPLRFYGIHLIAVLSFLGYSYVESSKIESSNGYDATRWEAHFKHPNLAYCKVIVDTFNNSYIFKISTTSTIEVNMKDPFDEITTETENTDRRISMIVTYLNDEGMNDLIMLRKINMLWMNIEEKTKWV